MQVSKEIRKAVWQYLLDHSHKERETGHFNVHFRVPDQRHFWYKVGVRARGEFLRKDSQLEQDRLQEMFETNLVLSQYIQKHKASIATRHRRKRILKRIRRKGSLKDKFILKLCVYFQSVYTKLINKYMRYEQSI